MSATATATRKEIYDRKSYDPMRNIGGLLGRVKLEMVAALDAELAPLDITAAQFVILKSIALGDAGSASGLCKDISYDPGAMKRQPDQRRGTFVEGRWRNWTEETHEASLKQSWNSF